MPAFDFDAARGWARCDAGRVLARRGDEELPFANASLAAGQGLLLDTCVYIDQMQDRSPGHEPYDHRGVNAMQVQELATWRQAGTPHTLLDVREPHELAICAVDGATHIPMSQVPARIAELPRDAPLVVMCHHGARSQMVVTFLRNAGRDQVFNLDGGIDAWARQIDGSVALY